MGDETPALFTRPTIWGSSASMRETASPTAFSSLMSTPRPRNAVPIGDCRDALAGRSSRSITATPCAVPESMRGVARPMPRGDAAPVTIAVGVVGKSMPGRASAPSGLPPRSGTSGGTREYTIYNQAECSQPSTTRCECHGQHDSGPRARPDGRTDRSNLVRAGIPLQVWNRTREIARPFADEGAEVRDELARIDAAVILSVLPDVPHLRGTSPRRSWRHGAASARSW